MKIAVISDIHANVYALQAVLEDLQSRGFDHLVNLGDIFYGPIGPKATYELLQQHEVTTIAGNQDRQIYESTEDEIAANATMQLVLDELEGEPLEWLKALPHQKQLTDNIYLCHGAPGDDMMYLLEDIAAGYPKVCPDEEIITRLQGRQESLILCGHTHIPRSVELSTGQLIVNPGSVGLPAYCDDEPIKHRMETHSSHASYAIVEEMGNSWTVQQLKVAYDFKAATEKCRLHKRQDWCYFLETGRGDI